MVSEDEERRGMTHTITESLATFTVFLGITLTRIAIDKITLYSTTRNEMVTTLAQGHCACTEILDEINPLMISSGEF